MTRTALISVYDKTGIIEFALELINLGWCLLASGGTAKVLKAAGLEVKDVAKLVGGGPILGHRVVTLSRELHAGILSQYDNKEDLAELEKLGLPLIDLVCVDLYPLINEINHSEATMMSVIDKTDIGGPTLLRAAAKGRRITVSNLEQYESVLTWLKEGEPDRENFLSRLASEAELLVSQYSLASARYHSQGRFTGFFGERVLECKYGENAYQAPAGLYSAQTLDALGLDKFKLVAGSAPSYNNICDVDRQLQTITHIAATFDINYNQVPFIGIAVKHGNTCGAAVGDNQAKVLEQMISGDTRAIFGGLVMVNFPIDGALAEVLLTYKMESGRRLLDGIIAPSFDTEAVKMLARKKDKCRFLANPALSNLSKNSLDTNDRFRHVRGGFLLQRNYTFALDLKDPEIKVIGPTVSDEQKKDILLAWSIGCTSNSNTIVLVKDKLLSNAVGQQDRIGAANLAITRAHSADHQIEGSVAYSDSFFPFVDGVETLVDAGITTIFTSSGSVRDTEIQEYCTENGVSLFMIPDLQARGFFGH